jgi:hypothetical protein
MKAFQIDIFGQEAEVKLPHQRHSVTSKAAAVSAEKFAGSARAQVLRFLIEFGAHTDEEISEALKMSGNTARPRRIELVHRGLVGKAGRARTHAGRWADLWGTHLRSMPPLEELQ